MKSTNLARAIAAQGIVLLSVNCSSEGFSSSSGPESSGPSAAISDSAVPQDSSASQDSGAPQGTQADSGQSNGSQTDSGQPASDAGQTTSDGGAPPSLSNAFLILPLNVNDVGYESFGLNPFGIHIAEHGSDGHPGLDFEFKPGTKALVVADGTVNSVFADVYDPTAFTVQLEHKVGTKHFRTVYTNIASVESAIVKGATVKQGDLMGTPKTISRTNGQRMVTYAMVHLQLDDFSQNYGLTNMNAVSPESYFVTSARTSLATIWARAAYSQEVCEPFLTNARGTTINPTHVRTWAAPASAPSSAPAKFEMSCANNGKGTAYSYRILDTNNVATQVGTASIRVNADGTTSVDLTPTTGSVRLALYTILDDKMTVRFGEPASARPSSLAGADVYVTTP